MVSIEFGMSISDDGQFVVLDFGGEIIEIEARPQDKQIEVSLVDAGSVEAWLVMNDATHMAGDLYSVILCGNEYAVYKLKAGPLVLIGGLVKSSSMEVKDAKKF